MSTREAVVDSAARTASTGDSVIDGGQGIAAIFERV